jgi:hypothetical protein
MPVNDVSSNQMKPKPPNDLQAPSNNFGPPQPGQPVLFQDPVQLAPIGNMDMFPPQIQGQAPPIPIQGGNGGFQPGPQPPAQFDSFQPKFEIAQNQPIKLRQDQINLQPPPQNRQNER